MTENEKTTGSYTALDYAKMGADTLIRKFTIIVMKDWLNDAYTNSTPGAQNAASTRDASGGAFDIAIPIRVNVAFGN